jgi:two-component system chemotaxis response regulator CheY
MAKPPRTALIVDDSTTIRRMVRAALAPLEGLSFVEGATGLEAIERLALNPVSVVVLDLNMPDMHGLEVLGFVRAHQKFHQLPVMVLTTRDDQGSRNAALQAGATAYLTKPFTPQALLGEARAVLDAVPQGK